LILKVSDQLLSVILDGSVEGNVTVCASSKSDVDYAQEKINEMKTE
jgi:hypothetical protein